MTSAPIKHISLGTMHLVSAEDVVAARLHARKAAEILGLDRQSQTRMATAVSEITRNAFTYAGKARAEFVIDGNAPAHTFMVVVSDDGPGIDDLHDVLEGRKVFAPGRGKGLPSARRLVDQFDIQSAPGGTMVRLAQRLPQGALLRLTREAQQAIAQLLSSHAGADPITALQDQNREIIESLNDLQDRQAETARLNLELEETNRGVVALYSELEEKAEQLRGVSDTKSRFLSHMSHEFRTPLNSILALARLLVDRVDGDLNAEQERQVQYIRKSAQSLLDMVNDLLDLAKVEAGKVDVKPVEFSVDSIFASLRGTLRPLLTNPAVDLLFGHTPQLPLMLADEQKVIQILRNFIANALKFTEQGHVLVEARHDPARQTIVFSVSDSGIGIAPQDIARIFEEFSQVDGRLQQGGTGLGLPLARRLALLMGGEVRATSLPGQGSTFELILPVRFGQVLSPQPDKGEDGRTGHVLVVDDEEAFRYVLRHIAQDAGYEVQEAPDGLSALQSVAEHRPAMIFLDLAMPQLDGFGVLERLAKSPELANIPVVVCTSQLLSIEQKRLLAGAHAIVLKQDVSRDGLTALIQSVTRDHQARSG
ncbi:response regulator [Aquabacterium soli]|uniref:histidine kinase n=1 Tax=Aquabacterium soli TaxID=2493092 RepID=A0A3R8YNU1_9BURK|nr:ATP-binding protein [Aquabacterium soli]RRS04648.1 response regulator [Aquabacterium soli]